MKKILTSIGIFSSFSGAIVSTVAYQNEVEIKQLNIETKLQENHRYDFSWGNTNPDSTNRPTTISELKRMVPNYYDSLSDTATGDDLFKELQKIQGEHRNKIGSYKSLWTHIRNNFTGDWFTGRSGYVMDLFGEVPISHGGSLTTGNRPYVSPYDQDGQGNSGSGEGVAYNREHMIPQSYARKGSEKKIKNDPHYTWPADRSVNSSRGNYHFAEVAKNKITKRYEQNSIPTSKGYLVNGGVAGTDPISNSKAVEPVDWFKGDIARSHMHFLVTWISDPYFQGNSGTNFKTFKPKSNLNYPYFSNNSYIDMYLDWSGKDPVDKFNVDLNTNIGKSNSLRNPFIDMPKLANLIWS